MPGYSEHRPEEWLCRGPTRPLGDDVWLCLHRQLTTEPEQVCVIADDVAITRAQVLAAIEALPWRHAYKRVGIHLPRSLAAVVATLATWRHGGAYVPVAVEYPAARLAAIATQCQLDVIIANAVLDVPGYEVVAAAMCFGVRLFFHASRLPHDQRDEPALCYIAHTSGSTGSPKGVRISHAALLNRLGAMQSMLSVTPQDRFIYKSPALFDVHVWEFALPLAAGAVLVIHPHSATSDLSTIAKLICDQRVTIAGFVPVLLQRLLQSEVFVAHNSLRTILCGGEAWGASLARQVRQALPGRTLHNSYGPTETTIAVNDWSVPSGAFTRVCLGAPLDNTDFLIAETSREHTASGTQIQGRLLIGGAQVALGYVEPNQSERFSEIEIAGAAVRFYDSGDLVRLNLHTEDVSFVGRADNQVKINGVRIELEEIEEAARGVAGAEHCVALVSPTGQLVLLYTTATGEALRHGPMRAELARALPTVLLPAEFHHVAQLPLTASGKIDRLQVAAPEPARMDHLHEA